MQNFICKHFRLTGKPAERRSVALVTALDNSHKILTCTECQNTPNFPNGVVEHVSEMYFKILLDEIRKLARKQEAEIVAN